MKKRIISFMLSLFMVLGLITPAADVEASTTRAEYAKVTVENPVASSWDSSGVYSTDGGPEYAFNNDANKQWHTNYNGTSGNNKDTSELDKTTVDVIPAFSEISSKRVWIGGEFAEAVNLGKFTYRSRTSTQIQQWALYTANITTGEPSDADFKLVASDTFGSECESGVEVVLTTPVKATHFRLVAFTFNGNQHATASSIEMYSVSQMNVTLRSGEDITYTLGELVKVDNPTLSGLDSNIVSGKVTEGRKSYPYSVAKLATATATFDGKEKELEECLFTFTSNDSGDAYLISNTDSTIYLASGMSNSAQRPCVSSGTNLNVKVGFDNGMFTLNNQYSNFTKDGYLYFHKESNTALHFNRFDKLETSNYNTHFDLFEPSENAPWDSEIKGYKKLTGLDQVKSGKSYLIAAKAKDGNYYILNPVVSEKASDYVAQVVTYETEVQLASATENFNDAAGVKKASDCLFTFTFIENAESGKNYRISAETADGTKVYLNHRKTAGITTTTNAEAVTTLQEKSTSEKSLFSLKDISANSTDSGFLYFYTNKNYYYDRYSWADPNYCYFKLYEPSSNASAYSEIEGYVEVPSLDSIKDGGQYLIVSTDKDGNYYFMYPFNEGSNYQYVAKQKKLETGADTTLTFTGVNEGSTSVTVNGITYNFTVQNINKTVIVRDDETIYIPGTSLYGENDTDDVINVVDQTGAPYTRAENIEDGYYLLGSASHLVINSPNGDGLAMQAANYTQGDYSAYIWSIKSEGAGYTVQDINGKYINFSGTSVVLSDTPQVLEITKRNSGGYAVSDGKVYLNNHAGGNHTAKGYSGNDNAWYFYRVGVEVTSNKQGNATIMLDGINYQIESLPMSKDSLNADILYAETTYKEADYLVSGWRAYAATLADVKTRAENATRQTEVNAAQKDLKNAIADLVIRPVYTEPTATEMAAGAPSGTTEGQPFIPKTNDTFGTAGSGNFRIPAMVTLSDGTIIAAADARWNHAMDACSIDIVVTKSEDNGKTWNYTLPAFFNDSTNAKHEFGACFIDPVLARDKHDKIYMMVDMFPGGIAINTAPNKPHAASGFVEIDGKNRLVLYLSNDPDAQTDINYAYYVGDYVKEGEKNLAPVYEVFAEGEYSDTPSFYMDSYFYLYTAEKEPMYCAQLADESKKVQQNVFFNNSILHVRCATYLYLITSEDKGQTWSEPMLLNSQIRKDENLDIFYGVGPGAGLCFDDGTELGTIMLPAYTHSNERASFIYSTDGGITWNRSENATSEQSSESCLVQLDSTTVRHFYRSGSSNLQYTDHTLVDGKWVAGEVVTLNNVVRRSGNQVSAIRYSKTIDGKPVIIYSTAGSAGGRKDGKLYLFTVDMDADGKPMQLVATYDNVPNNTEDYYAYSSIAELNNGSIGLLYESAGSQITYKTISIEEFVPADSSMTTVKFDIPFEAPSETPDETEQPGDVKIEAEVAGVNLILEGNIGVKFHVKLGKDVINPENNAYMQFTVGDNKLDPIPVADITPTTVNGIDYYIFKCPVPVKNMGTEIKAQIIVPGVGKGSVYTYTVDKYIEYIKNDKTYASATKLLTLVDKMSNFGNLADTYFSKKDVDKIDPVTENEKEDLRVVGRADSIIPEKETSIYYGSSLLLESNTTLRHYFNENVKVVSVAVGDKTVDISGYISKSKGGLYYIEHTGIPAHELAEYITIVVRPVSAGDDTTKDITLKYSPLTYAHIALSRDVEADNLTSLIRAMYAYQKAAYDYIK